MIEKSVSISEVLNRVNKVLNNENCSASNAVALSDVMSLLKEQYYKYENLSIDSTLKLNRIVKNEKNSASIIIRGFNEKKQFEVDYTDNVKDVSSYEKMLIKKENGTLILTNNCSKRCEQVFSLVKSSLTHIYDEYTLYSPFLYEEKQIDSLEPIFKVKITYEGIIVNVISIFSEESILEVNINCDYQKQPYIVNCKALLVKALVENNIEHFLNNLFVEISECPKWMRESLTDIRLRQLKKEKWLSLKQKVFNRIRVAYK